MASRGRLLPLALGLYALLLAYGSLYPLHDLRLPAPHEWGFLIAPPPAFVTRTDLATNVLVYLPFGWLLARWLGRTRRLRAALPWTFAAGALLSGVLEVGQLFVPGRVASNVDIATNALGALLGGLAYGLARVQRRPGRWVAALAHRVLAPGRLPQAGLLVLTLWFLAQLSLDAPSLLAGRLKSGFVPFWEVEAALDRLEPGLALVYALELVVVGSLLAGVLRRPPSSPALTLIAAGGLVVGKFLAAAVLLKWAVLARLVSLEFVTGLAAGAISLQRCLDSRGGARWAPAAFALALGGLVPFLGVLPVPGSAAPRHFNITGLAAGMAVLWPWLAALVLAARAWLAQGAGDHGGNAANQGQP